MGDFTAVCVEKEKDQWYGFSGINKKAAPPWGRSFGTQKRLICAASIRSKMAAASRAAFSTSLWAAMP